MRKKNGKSSPLPFWERVGVRGVSCNKEPLIPAFDKAQADLLPKQEKGSATLLIVFIVIVIATVFLLLHARPCTNFHEATLQTSTQNISISIADASEKQSRGLGGCTYIPKNSGMYFTAQGKQVTFWMKDMLIPIDIIWIKHSEVIGIEQNVPNAPKNTPDSALTTYPSPGEIDAVLEIEAGKAEEYGIIEGSRLNLT